MPTKTIQYQLIQLKQRPLCPLMAPVEDWETVPRILSQPLPFLPLAQVRPGPDISLVHRKSLPPWAMSLRAMEMATTPTTMTTKIFLLVGKSQAWQCRILTI
jgi:hypothetical protein